MLVMTTSRLTTFGKMCRMTITGGLTPVILARVTKSISLIPRTSPRIMRAYPDQTPITTAKYDVLDAGPPEDYENQSEKYAGECESGVADPHYQGVDPSSAVAGCQSLCAVPAAVPVIRAVMLITTLVRAPKMSLLSMSWPRMSVPKG